MRKVENRDVKTLGVSDIRSCVLLFLFFFNSPRSRDDYAKSEFAIETVVISTRSNFARPRDRYAGKEIGETKISSSRRSPPSLTDKEELLANRRREITHNGIVLRNPASRTIGIGCRTVYVTFNRAGYTVAGFCRPAIDDDE